MATNRPAVLRRHRHRRRRLEVKPGVHNRALIMEVHTVFDVRQVMMRNPLKKVPRIHFPIMEIY